MDLGSVFCLSLMIYERSKLLYRRLLLIVNSLRHFNFLKLNSVFRADETEWLENLSIFPGNLIYEHYEADTEADKVAPHCYVCGSFYKFSIFMVFFCNG